MTAPSDEPRTARDRLLRAAAALFYDDGVTATGIDTITQRAGVAKQSLYNNFKSKDALVAAYLEARHAEWLDLYAAREAAAKTPSERILAVFDAYGDHAAAAYSKGFRGCGLLNAAAELASDHEGRQAVRHHKEDVDRILLGHLSELLPEDPAQTRRLAAHLAFLVEGAMARAGLEGTGARVDEARGIARTLVGPL